MTSAERARRRAELMAELVELAQAELPKLAQTLDELEDLTVPISEEVARAVLERLAERQQEPELPTEHTCVQCRRRAQYNCRYELELVTSLGRTRLARPYFHCHHCRQGCVPVDAAWRLGPRNTTARPQARVAYLAHCTAYHRLPASFQQLGLPPPPGREHLREDHPSPRDGAGATPPGRSGNRPRSARGAGGRGDVPDPRRLPRGAVRRAL